MPNFSSTKHGLRPVAQPSNGSSTDKDKASIHQSIHNLLVIPEYAKVPVQAGRRLLDQHRRPLARVGRRGKRTRRQKAEGAALHNGKDPRDRQETHTAAAGAEVGQGTHDAHQEVVGALLHVQWEAVPEHGQRFRLPHGLRQREMHLPGGHEAPLLPSGSEYGPRQSGQQSQDCDLP